MYKVVFENGKFWISYKGKLLEDIGSFDEPISPQVIIEEIKDEI